MPAFVFLTLFKKLSYFLEMLFQKLLPVESVKLVFNINDYESFLSETLASATCK